MNYGRGQYRPMPKDFEAHAGESYTALTKRYHACTATINRWKALCGTNIPKERPVIGRDDMGRERSFPSISEAARQTPGAKPAPIWNAIQRGGRAYGYWWRYADRRDR